MRAFNTSLTSSLADSRRGTPSTASARLRRPRREADAEQLAHDLAALVRLGLIDLHVDSDDELRAEVRGRG
jgi:hypothetical protein